MAGFLNKKDRLIDYKLTENGRKQLASGDIRFKYYTFSDRSIKYESVIKNNKIVSDSEFYYLPFEVTTDPGLFNNTEYYLSNELTFNNTDYNNIYSRGRSRLVDALEKLGDENFSSISSVLDRIRENRDLNLTDDPDLANLASLFQTNNLQTTLAQTLSSQRYLTTKKITNNLVINYGEIIFDNINFRPQIDFINSNLVRRYPTVKLTEESIENLKNVKKDKRFSNHIKNKKLIPLSSLNTKILLENVIESNQEKSSPIDFIFKTLDIRNNIKRSDTREEVIIKAINKIEENKDKVFCFSYKLNNSYLSNNDVFSFEMHNLDNQNKLNKLPVVNLGSFFDKQKNKHKSVYLIGKFFKKNELDEIVNFENKTYHFEEISNYYFVNLFTLVAE